MIHADDHDYDGHSTILTQVHRTYVGAHYHSAMTRTALPIAQPAPMAITTLTCQLRWQPHHSHSKHAAAPTLATTTTAQ
ncbi:hypothetical protein SCLCIDRAFT_1211937, partial [Scleroderma citrinum Foug A]